MRPPLLPPVGSHQTNPFEQQDVRPSSEWTRLSESKDFTRFTEVYVHCHCGLTVELQEDGVEECECGRQYRLLLTVEVLVRS